jgi:hypothetical protein
LQFPLHPNSKPKIRRWQKLPSKQLKALLTPINGDAAHQRPIVTNEWNYGKSVLKTQEGAVKSLMLLFLCI